MEEVEKQQIEKILERANHPTNILFVGATGSGKSSTINALFNNKKAKVGFGADPETKDIQKYELGHNLTLWDSPGFGDSKDNDRVYAQEVEKLLLKKDNRGDALVDLVVVIADNASRDLGTIYQLISNVIINSLAENDKNRIVVALNKTDLLAGGNYWNRETNRPEIKLETKIIEKEESVRNRIFADGADVKIMDRFFRHQEVPDSENFPKPGFQLKPVLFLGVCVGGTGPIPADERKQVV